MSFRLQILLFASFGFLALLLSWGVFLHTHWIFSFDTGVNATVFVFPPDSWEVFIFRFLTELASKELVISIFLLILGYFFWKKKWRDVGVVFLFFVGGNAFVHLFLKPFFNRDRPDGMLVMETDGGFPSGHTFAAVMLVFLLFYFFRTQPFFQFSKARTWFWGFSGVYMGLIALSRLILHAHFVSDVLESVFLGAFLGMGMIIWGRRDGGFL
ncbi:MAG: phosphatase PAP2 family protein [Candidatus Peregrinibacteria bacterium]